MKIRILIVAILVFGLFSCNEELDFNNITLEEATSQQFVSFEIGDRKIHLTEFRLSSRPSFLYTSKLEIDTVSNILVIRSIYAPVPEDQSLNNHIETFGIVFNKFFSKVDVDLDSSKVLDNEQFRSDFFSTGEQDISLSNFSFQQTYLAGVGQPDHSFVRIDKIQYVLDEDDMIFVTGEFEGSIGFDEYIGRLKEGKFKILVKN